MIVNAKEMIDNNIYSCIVVKEDKVLHSVLGKGIRPLLNLYNNNRKDLKDSFLADKIIGKAAAIIIIASKIKHVYGYIVSKNALEMLSECGIKVEYNELTDKIYNAKKTDMCPLEKIVMSCNNINDGLESINSFIN